MTSDSLTTSVGSPYNTHPSSTQKWVLRKKKRQTDRQTDKEREREKDGDREAGRESQRGRINLSHGDL